MEHGTSITRLNPDGGERFQALRRDLGVSTFGMNLITLQPGDRGRIHEHERQEEVMVVIEGILDVLTPDGVQELHANDLMRIAPDVRRQLVNRGPGRAVVLALGGSQEHDGRDGRAFSSFQDTEAKAPQDLPNPEPLQAADLRE